MNAEHLNGLKNVLRFLNLLSAKCADVKIPGNICSIAHYAQYHAEVIESIINETIQKRDAE